MRAVLSNELCIIITFLSVTVAIYYTAPYKTMNGHGGKGTHRITLPSQNILQKVFKIC